MIALALQSTLVFTAAWCAAVLLRRRSAAVRHFVWTAAFAAVLLLPFATLLRDRPTVVIAVPDSTIVVDATTAAAPVSRAIPWLLILYAAGAALVAARFLAGAIVTGRLVRRGEPSNLGDEFGFRVILSAEAPMPLASGILRRVVVLPLAAASWPAARLRSVLLHESLHHRRRDLPAQAIGQIACCLYWMHPLAWVALYRQRAERERACDDAVLRHGVAPHDYASHLVEVVRAVTGRGGWSNAPAMAETSGLESRVRAVLNGSADRRPLTRGAALAIVALLAPLSLVTVRAQAPVGISGVVEDPSGGRVPNCKVTARNLDGTNIESTTADATGEYRFTGIPGGRYELSFATPGFVLAKIPLTYVSGAALRIDAHLEVGSVMESVTVRGARTTPPPAPQANTAPPRRIPIGGNVQMMRLVRQPRPVYPPELREAGVEGTVVIRAIVSKDGRTLAPRVVSTTDARLNQAALDSVNQWLYEPTLLNGQPVETLATIEVHFELNQ